MTATIAVKSGSDLRLGGMVFFDVTGVEKLTKNAEPRIQLEAYQNGELVYAEARDVKEQPFTLGGSSSRWKNDEGGPAHCVAILYYWTFHPSQIFHPLARVEFEATG